MKIAIIGSGISGLVAAFELSGEHAVTVFEAGNYIGGHTHTVDVEFGGERHAIDTGFIVFNDWTYPNFIALLNRLGVASEPTSMSFSVRCDRTGLEYNGASLNQLFAQRRNLLRPRFYRMVADILRFNREAPRDLSSADDQTTVAEYVAAHRYSNQFVDQYLYPMGSAIWSCPPQKFASFPIRFIIEFYRNHGLLSVTNRPTWRVIKGGSRTYVDKLTHGFRERIRLNCPVLRVTRSNSGATVVPAQGEPEDFDHVVFACHSDQALAILRDPTPVERELLGAFPYEPNVAVLHTDISVLPRRKSVWASWNYLVPPDGAERATVTYNMNILQQLESKHVFCVTLNREENIRPELVLRRMVYHHPLFTTRRAAAQRRHGELINCHSTSYCGAYWGNGFHEDGVVSALAVCRALSAREHHAQLPL